MPIFDSTTAHMPVGTIVPANRDQLVIKVEKIKENEKIKDDAHMRHLSVAVAKGEGSAQYLRYRR